jgi:hypothetical protein
MPPELENASVIFTDEAEAAIKKSLARWERRLRARALDEAVRARGVPAEVTGSDIERASNRLGNRGFVDGRKTVRFRSHSSDEYRFRELRAPELNEKQVEKSKTPSALIAKLYIWLGLAGTFGGLLYAPVFHRYKALAADPAWRIGFLLATTSFCIFVTGIIFKTFIQKRRRDTRSAITTN